MSTGPPFNNPCPLRVAKAMPPQGYRVSVFCLTFWNEELPYFWAADVRAAKCETRPAAALSAARAAVDRSPTRTIFTPRRACARAPVAELVDAPDSKSGGRKVVLVRVRPGAPLSLPIWTIMAPLREGRSRGLGRRAAPRAGANVAQIFNMTSLRIGGCKLFGTRPSSAGGRARHPSSAKTDDRLLL